MADPYMVPTGLENQGMLAEKQGIQGKCVIHILQGMLLHVAFCLLK